MGIVVAPGVYSNELDLSLYAPALSTTQVGMVIEAESGPEEEVVSISSQSEFIRFFGRPIYHGGRAAFEYLREGHQLRVVRVVKSDAVLASATAVDAVPVNTLTFKDKWFSVRIVKVYISDSPFTGKRVSIEVDGELAEQFDNLADKDAILNISSEFVTITDIALGGEPDNQVLTLTGGSTGGVPASADVIGLVSGDDSTGLQLFADPNKVDINLLCAPGFLDVDATIYVAGEGICRGRGDAMWLQDPPLGLSSSEVIDYHNGTGSYSHNAMNSSYAAIFWPWHEVFDPYQNSKVWVPPSVPMLSILAYSDYVADPWVAPAGLTRGRASRSLNIEVSPDQGKISDLYGDGNAVNPFVKFIQEGITLWGQRTLQRMPSALDRINVRRMVLYARKVLATAVKYLVFDPNDSETWKKFRSLARQAMAPIASRRGVYSYQVICDESTNPPSQIDQKQMKGKVVLQPTQAAEIITIDWQVLNTGAEFNES